MRRDWLLDQRQRESKRKRKRKRKGKRKGKRKRKRKHCTIAYVYDLSILRKPREKGGGRGVKSKKPSSTSHNSIVSSAKPQPQRRQGNER